MRRLVYLITCAVAAMSPFFHGGTTAEVGNVDYDFINTFHSADLTPIAMTAGESDFYADFPGTTGFFAVTGLPGERVFLRYTEEPTRKLHSAEGCYRASGREIEFIDNVLVTVEELSSSPLPWSQFRLIEDGRHFLVRQCVLSLSTRRAYADVPAWYWQTTFSMDDPGPWLAVTWRLPDPGYNE